MNSKSVFWAKMSLSEDIYSVPDPNQEFKCSDSTLSKGFTLLMKWVMMTNSHPELYDRINQLIKENPEELNKQNEKGWTALMLAVSNSGSISTEETVKLLLSYGAKINIQGQYGHSALTLAVRKAETYGTKNTIKMLIKAGANLNIQNDMKWSALMIAVYNARWFNTEKTIKRLIKAGANLEIKDRHNSTAIIHMLQDIYPTYKEKIIKLLLTAGAQIKINILVEVFGKLTELDIFFFLKYNNVTSQEIIDACIPQDKKFLTIKLFLELERTKKLHSNIIKKIPNASQRLRENYKLIPLLVEDSNIISFKKVAPVGIRILNFYKEKLPCNDPEIILLLGIKDLEDGQKKIKTYCDFYFS